MERNYPRRKESLSILVPASSVTTIQVSTFFWNICGGMCYIFRVSNQLFFPFVFEDKGTNKYRNWRIHQHSRTPGVQVATCGGTLWLPKKIFWAEHSQPNLQTDATLQGHEKCTKQKAPGVSSPCSSASFDEVLKVMDTWWEVHTQHSKVCRLMHFSPEICPTVDNGCIGWESNADFNLLLKRKSFHSGLPNQHWNASLSYHLPHWLLFPSFYFICTNAFCSLNFFYLKNYFMGI